MIPGGGVGDESLAAPPGGGRLAATSPPLLPEVVDLRSTFGKAKWDKN